MLHINLQVILIFIKFNTSDAFHKYCETLSHRRVITNFVDKLENVDEKALEKFTSNLEKGINFDFLNLINLGIFDYTLQQNKGKLPQPTEAALDNFLTKKGEWKKVCNFFKKIQQGPLLFFLPFFSNFF